MGTMRHKGNVYRQDFLAFLEGYRACMLWANSFRYVGEELQSTCFSGEECEYRASYPRAFFIGAFLVSSARDCRAFIVDNRAALDLCEESGTFDYERAGLLFALSRNGHGAGFFDFEYGALPDVSRACRALQTAARVWGESSLLLESVEGETGPNGEPIEKASGL